MNILLFYIFIFKYFLFHLFFEIKTIICHFSHFHTFTHINFYIFFSVIMANQASSCADHSSAEFSMTDGIVTVYPGTKFITRQTFKDIMGKIKGILFPGTLISFGNKAFKGYAGAPFRIPDGVEELGHFCFADSGSFREVTIPSSVRGLGVGVFSGCKNLESVRFEEGSECNVSRECFEDCPRLRTVVFSSQLNIIQRKAFSCCTSLTSVEFPGSLYLIEQRAFEYCENLSQIRLPLGIDVAEDAFSGCHFERLSIGPRVQMSGFAVHKLFSSCERIHVRADVPPDPRLATAMIAMHLFMTRSRQQGGLGWGYNTFVYMMVLEYIILHLYDRDINPHTSRIWENHHCRRCTDFSKKTQGHYDLSVDYNTLTNTVSLPVPKGVKNTTLYAQKYFKQNGMPGKICGPFFLRFF